MLNLILPKQRKPEVFIDSMVFKLEEMQPLSIKYFVLIYRACEETILSPSGHEQTFESGAPLRVSKF
jgi:hypothetical protein